MVGHRYSVGYLCLMMIDMKNRMGIWPCSVTKCMKQSYKNSWRTETCIKDLTHAERYLLCLYTYKNCTTRQFLMAKLLHVMPKFLIEQAHVASNIHSILLGCVFTAYRISASLLIQIYNEACHNTPHPKNLSMQNASAIKNICPKNHTSPSISSTFCPLFEMTLRNVDHRFSLPSHWSYLTPNHVT